MKRRDFLEALGAALPLSMLRDDWMAAERHVEPPVDTPAPLKAEWTDTPEYKEWEIPNEPETVHREYVGGLTSAEVEFQIIEDGTDWGEMLANGDPVELSFENDVVPRGGFSGGPICYSGTWYLVSCEMVDGGDVLMWNVLMRSTGQLTRHEPGHAPSKIVDCEAWTLTIQQEQIDATSFGGIRPWQSCAYEDYPDEEDSWDEDWDEE